MSHDPLTYSDMEQLLGLLDRFERNHATLPHSRNVATDATILVGRVLQATWPNGDDTPGEKIRCTITVPDGYMAENGIEYFEEAIAAAAAELNGDTLSANLDDGDSYNTSVFPLDVKRWED